jgi:hypothetical protein
VSSAPSQRIGCFASRHSRSAAAQSCTANSAARNFAPEFCGRDARAQKYVKRGQVAQVVERSPEKAGVGGSTPSLATIKSTTCMGFGMVPFGAIGANPESRSMAIR